MKKNDRLSNILGYVVGLLLGVVAFVWAVLKDWTP